MDGLYWLISLIIIAAGAYAARYWYNRPSGMPGILSASYSDQILEYMNTFAQRKGEDSEEYDIPKQVITSQMKRRKLGWRQRNDIIEYMNKVGWVQEFDDHGLKSYRISKAGKQELKTAYGLYEAVREAAHTLHDQGVSGDQAKATAAAVIAAALRVDARSGPSDSRTHAAASANEIEDAVRARDPARVDRIVTRTRDTLQIATYALPFVRDILRIIGSL